MAGFEVSVDQGLARLVLNKARGNAIDEPLLLDLQAELHRLGRDPTVHGLLLASGHAKLFSPGLDLVALTDYDAPMLLRFLTLFDEVVALLHGFPRPVVAALSGSALAGGCVFAMCADVRIMAKGDARIGLNESKVGVALPYGVTRLLCAVVPPQQLTRMALMGVNYSADEALAAGLVDQAVPAAEVLPACETLLRELLQREPAALSLTKSWLRAPVLESMRAAGAEHRRQFAECWFSPGTQARLRSIIASLRK
ncbi:MAG: enoyl-CoA hydratase/isomerase family protein [Planctomycetes bacterium]|nr:enoyl-CoA hydratase/isomerase family protein [Planctomycetota bacterium]